MIDSEQIRGQLLLISNLKDQSEELYQSEQPLWLKFLYIYVLKCLGEVIIFFMVPLALINKMLLSFNLSAPKAGKRAWQ